MDLRFPPLIQPLVGFRRRCFGSHPGAGIAAGPDNGSDASLGDTAQMLQLRVYVPAELADAVLESLEIGPGGQRCRSGAGRVDPSAG